MVGINTPDGWSFKSMWSNPQFNNDGHRLVYDNDNEGVEIVLEYVIDEDASEEEWDADRAHSVLGLVRESGTRSTIDHQHFTFGGGDDPKERAKEWAKRQMEGF